MKDLPRKTAVLKTALLHEFKKYYPNFSQAHLEAKAEATARYLLYLGNEPQADLAEPNRERDQP